MKNRSKNKQNNNAHKKFCHYAECRIKDYISLLDYKRFKDIKFSSTLQTKIPTKPVPDTKEEPVPDTKEDRSPLDHCAPNLSREERLRRLSKYGKLREKSSHSYSAGERSVSFFSDGSLIYCN